MVAARVLAAVDGEGEEELEIRSRIPEPRQWSAEAPHLYDLLLTLKNADGEVVEVLHIVVMGYTNQ